MKKLKNLKGIFSPKGASRTSCIILAGVLSVPFTLSIVWVTDRILGIYFDTSIAQILEPRGAWTLITLIFSSPVALVVWHFRDENTKEQIENHRQQVENQRKDVNLKEFQKISEWVSGIHLSEEDNNEEKAEDNTKKSNQTNSIVYNKYNGAIALQISSIHSLLPFLRGDHGESFKKPALNLLKSAWHMLHYNNLQELKGCEDIEEARKIIRDINKRSHDAFGSSLMQVLLADGGEYLHQHPEVFSFICLSGINIHLPGLHYSTYKKLFSNLENAFNMQLQAAFLENTYFINSKMQGVNFHYSQLDSSSFDACNLCSAKFYYADIKHSLFKKTMLIQANFNSAIATFGRFEDCNLEDTEIINANFEGSRFVKVNLSGSNLEKTTLKDAYFENVCLESAILTGANMQNSVLKEVNLNKANLQNVDFNGAKFIEIDAIETNFVNSKNLILDELKSATYIRGAIINFSDLYPKDTIEYLKSKDMIFIVGEATNLIANDKTTLLVYQPNSGFQHTYNISNFEIDISRTREFNPNWKITPLIKPDSYHEST